MPTRPFVHSLALTTTDNLNRITFEPAHPCRCTERVSRTAQASRRTRPAHQSMKKKKHTPSETNTSLHGHSLHNTTHDAPGAHLTLEALGVDAEVAGRALAVVGGGEAGELFHRPPRRRVVVARGGADAEEEREDDEARRGGRLRRHDASFFRWLLCWVGFDGELGTGGYFVRGAREI